MSDLSARVAELQDKMRACRAEIESDPAAAATYLLAAMRLEELLPFLLREHGRLKSLVDVDPDQCRATYLSCMKRISEGFERHEEHFDPSGTRWSRDHNGITMTYGHPL